MGWLRIREVNVTENNGVGCLGEVPSPGILISQTFVLPFKNKNGPEVELGPGLSAELRSYAA